MTDERCPKCKAIREYVQGRILNPPGPFGLLEDYMNNSWRDILAILDKKTPVEQAAKKATTTGNHKDLHKYLKIRRIQ